MNGQECRVVGLILIDSTTRESVTGMTFNSGRPGLDWLVRKSVLRLLGRRRQLPAHTYRKAQPQAHTSRTRTLPVPQVTAPVRLALAPTTNDSFSSDSVTKTLPSTFAPTASIVIPEAKGAKHAVIDNGTLTTFEQARVLMTWYPSRRLIGRLLSCLLLIVPALSR